MYCVNGFLESAKGLTLPQAFALAKELGLAMIYREDSRHFLKIIHDPRIKPTEAWLLLQEKDNALPCSD